MDLAQQTPAEIDTVLGQLWDREQTLRFRLRSTRDYLKREQVRSPGGRLAADYEGQVAKLEADVADVRAQAEPLEAEFSRRGGWLRYFLVPGDSGHVHRGTYCQTCFPTTQFAWLPELSDCDEDAMIVEFGEKACTVCFPGAPTNPAYHGPGRRDAAAKAEREAEKAAREAAKATKAARIAERNAKATAKAAETAAAKAAGTHKLSPSEKRDAAIGRISETGQAGDWDGVLAAIQEAKALGKTDRWQAALRNVEAVVKTEDKGGFIQSLINLGWANS
jgi:hypothetical protein